MNKRVVIVGGGFGGAYCAQTLERIAPGVEILLLDRNNYFVFYPLLIEAGTGSLDPSHVVVPLRSFLKRASFKMAEVVDLDFAKREVHYLLQGSGERQSTTCDHLVIALGSVTRMPEVPGLERYGLQVKSLADAIRLRDRAVRFLEEANATDDERRRRELLHFVVVGGNFTGAEVTGEMLTFLRRAARRYPNITTKDIRITLVDLSDRILSSLDLDLADYAMRNLRRRGVDIRTRTTVEEIQADQVRLSSGEMLDASTVVWCAGVAPNPLVAHLDLPRDERGYILCTPALEVKDRKNVWAIGDCALNPDPTGNPYPATAQHAVRQGVQLARNIRSALQGGTPQPIRIKTLGSLAALGCRSGVAKVLGFKISGFPAWWLYRSAYLIKMPGLSRKLRVALDWTLDLLFARDDVPLGISVHETHQKPS